MNGDIEDVIDCMARMKGEEQPFAVATVVRSEGATAARVGAKAVVRADGTMVGWVGGGCTLGAVKRAAANALVDGRARLIRVRPDAAGPSADGAEDFTNSCASGGTADIFIEPVAPRPALIILGASPTALALADLAKRLGFAVTAAAVSGDADDFAGADRRLASFDLSAEPRASASYVVVATQGKRDRDALKAALATGAPYVAFVGSRRKAAQLAAELAGDGVDRARLAALRSPAGIHIGAVTPAEIALSILTEIVAERRLGAGALRSEKEAQVTTATTVGSCCA
ncbi:MAG TPA: XdhC family protein [Stellaceae bacterium]|jgi:xanthine dehydrogenase accessory factor|nr:XdhC family protein [Stellaceae bacterium]